MITDTTDLIIYIFTGSVLLIGFCAFVWEDAKMFFSKKEVPVAVRADANLPLDLRLKANVLMPEILKFSQYHELAIVAANCTSVFAVSSIECADGNKLYRGYLDEHKDVFVETAHSNMPNQYESVAYALWNIEFPKTAEEWADFINLDAEVWTSEEAIEFTRMDGFQMTERGILDPFGNTGWQGKLISHFYINDTNPNDILRIDVHTDGSKPCVKWLRGMPLPSDFEYYPIKEVL